MHLSHFAYVSRRPHGGPRSACPHERSPAQPLSGMRAHPNMGCAVADTCSCSTESTLNRLREVTQYNTTICLSRTDRSLAFLCSFSTLFRCHLFSSGIAVKPWVKLLIKMISHRIPRLPLSHFLSSRHFYYINLKSLYRTARCLGGLCTC